MLACKEHPIYRETRHPDVSIWHVGLGSAHSVPGILNQTPWTRATGQTAVIHCTKHIAMLPEVDTLQLA